MHDFVFGIYENNLIEILILLVVFMLYIGYQLLKLIIFEHYGYVFMGIIDYIIVLLTLYYFFHLEQTNNLIYKKLFIFTRLCSTLIFVYILNDVTKQNSYWSIDVYSVLNVIFFKLVILFKTINELFDHSRADNQTRLNRPYQAYLPYRPNQQYPQLSHISYAAYAAYVDYYDYDEYDYFDNYDDYILYNNLSRNQHNQSQSQTQTLLDDKIKNISIDLNNLTNNTDECSICYDNNDNKYIKLIACDHEFHKKCLIKWLELNKSTCPLCRTLL